MRTLNSRCLRPRAVAMSSLADQLAAFNSKSESTKNKVKKGRASILFSPEDAADIDSDSIYTMGINGFQELCDLDPRIATFETKLFSKAAKGSNRDLQDADFNADLDLTLLKFLNRASPYALLKPVHKVFEYFVRHFKVHERNVDAFLGCVLPFHSTKIFARVLSVCAIEDTRWLFLAKAQQAKAYIERSVLVTRCCDDLSLVTLLCDLAQSVSDGRHRAKTIISFTTVLFIEVLQRCKSQPDVLKGFFSRIVTHITEALKCQEVPEFQMAGYMLVVSLCQSGTRLTRDLFCYFVSTALVNAPQDRPEEALRCLVHVYQTAEKQGVHVPLPAKAYSRLRAMESRLVVVLKKFVTSGVNIAAFISAVLRRLIPQLVSGNSMAMDIFTEIIKTLPQMEGHVPDIVHQTFCLVENGEHEREGLNRLRTVLELVASQYGNALDSAMEAALAKSKDRKTLYEFVMSTFSNSRHRPVQSSTTSNVSEGDGSVCDTTLFLALQNSLESVRLHALDMLREVASDLDKDGGSDSDREFVYDSLSARIGQDDSPAVVKKAASILGTISWHCQEELSLNILGSIKTALTRLQKNALVGNTEHLAIEALVRTLGSGFVGSLPDSGVNEHVGLLFDFLPTVRGLNSQRAGSVWPSKGSMCQEAIRVTESPAWKAFSFFQNSKVITSTKTDCTPNIESSTCQLQERLAKNILAMGSKDPKELNRTLSMFEALELHINGLTFVLEVLSSALNSASPKKTSLATVSILAKSMLRMLINTDFSTPAPMDEVFALEQALLAVNKLSLSPADTAYTMVAESLSAAAEKFVQGGLEIADDETVYITTTFLYFLSKAHHSKTTATESIMSMIKGHFQSSPLEFLLLFAQPAAVLDKMSVTYNDRIRGLCLELANSCMESSKASLVQETGKKNRVLGNVDFQIVMPYLLSLMRSSSQPLRSAAHTIFVEQLGHCKSGYRVYGKNCGSGTPLFLPNSVLLSNASVATIVNIVRESKHDIAKEPAGVERCMQRVFNDGGHLSREDEINVCHWFVAVAENMISSEPWNAMLMILSLQKAPSSCIISCVGDMVKQLLTLVSTENQNPFHTRTLQMIIDHFSKYHDAEIFTENHLDLFLFILNAPLYHAKYIPLNQTLSIITPTFCKKLPKGGANEIFATMFRLISDGKSGFRRDYAQLAIKALPFSADVLFSIIDRLMAEANSKAKKGSKRPKKNSTTDSATNVLGVTSLWIAHATALAEICHIKEGIAGSRRMASLLMDILRLMIKSNSDLDSIDFHNPSEYGIHMLMEAVRVLLERSSSDDAPGSFSTKEKKRKKSQKQTKIHMDEGDVETIVQCIQHTSSSQTRNSGLLLLAHLAREAPRALLNSLVPVFTFMGESVVRHDDNYTFHVIQKIVESVVRAVREVQSEHKLTLKNLLNIFVRSLKKILPHRRQRLLCMVVSILKSGALATTISLLMAEKHIDDEVGADVNIDLVSFGLELAHHFSVEDQTRMVAQLINSLSRESLGKDEEPDEEMELDEEEIELNVFFPPLSSVSSDFAHVRQYVKNVLGFLSQHLTSKGFLRRLVHAQQRGEESRVIHGSFMRSCQDLIVVMRKISRCKDSAIPGSPEILFWNGLGGEVYAVLAKITSALTTPAFLTVIVELLQHETSLVRKHALNLLQEKIADERDDFDDSECLAFLDMLDDIPDMLGKGGKHDVPDIQISIFTLDILVGAFGTDYPKKFAAFPKLLSGMLTSKLAKNHSVLLDAVHTSLAKMCSVFGTTMIPFLTPLMTSLLSSLKTFTDMTAQDISSLTDSRKDRLEYSLNAMAIVVKKLPNFCSPYLTEMLSFLLSRREGGIEVVGGLTACADTLIGAVASCIEPRILLPICYNVYPTLKVPSYECRFFDMLALHVSVMNKENIKLYHLQVFKLYLQSFKSHDQLKAAESEAYRESMLNSFVTLIMKLNEKKMRPLFFKTKEFIGEGDAEDDDSIMRTRTVLLFHLCDKLAENLKSIFIPFLSYVFEIAMEELKDFLRAVKQKDQMDEEKLEWHIQSIQYILSTLTKCFLYDAAAVSVKVDGYEKFITQARFNMSVDVLTDLLACYAVDSKRNSGDYEDLMSDYVSPCIANFVLAAGNDELWKGVHHRVCLHTRHDRSIVRLHSLKTIQLCFEEVGEEYLVMLPETISYLSELLEDQNENVEQLARVVKGQLEALSGGESLDTYLFG